MQIQLLKRDRKQRKTKEQKHNPLLRFADVSATNGRYRSYIRPRKFQKLKYGVGGNNKEGPEFKS